jgi:hypothetical protein
VENLPSHVGIVMSEFMNVKKIGRDFIAIPKKLLKMQEVATVRTINIVAPRAKTMLAADVWEDTGISKATAKRRIEVKKASYNNYYAYLIISGERVTYPGPRQLKKGASFVGKKRKRRKITVPIYSRGLGSIPFVIPLPAGGKPGGKTNKKAAVFVRPGYTSRKNLSKKKIGSSPQPRRVTALYYSSIAHVARKDWQDRVDNFVRKELIKEYPKQLRKAKY